MSKKSICTQCGAESEGEKRFCGICGGAMNVVEVQDNPEPASDAQFTDFGGGPVNSAPTQPEIPVIPNIPNAQPVQPQQQSGGKKGLAIAGMCVGISSLIFTCYGPLAIIIGAVGLILSILGLKSSVKGMAIAGIICAAIAVFLGLITTIACGGIMCEAFKEGFYEGFYDYY